MTVVSFVDYVPSPRADNLPWTQVKIEESATETGTYTLIDTITLSPVEPDPLHPIPRTFTTHAATLTEGWYRVTFKDAAGDLDPTDPVQHRSTPYLPALSDVGALLRARTKETAAAGGNEVGTFTADTRPTAMEADRLVVEAADDVVGELGGLDTVADVAPVILPTVWRAMRGLVALRAAMLVELSYFPEQVGSGKSPYDKYEAMYSSRLASLKEVTGGMPTADWASLGVVSHTVDAAYRPAIFGADLIS